ncbi:MAG TPA: iron-containing alcohol dehydrogenase [Pyrinomonadaceae bacterium]|jgi:alcohol dehydrogenase|nr:iron-containing alcohol dehydrogenase [Pyrinomonadaceae bacterium]
MESFDFQPRTRVIFGAGVLRRLGEVARTLDFKRTLLVADGGLVAAGHVAEASKFLDAAGVAVFAFHDFGSNPDTAMIERGRASAAPLGVDSIVALGGGSSLDCAKAVNFLLTSGGRMQDYHGFGKAKRPMLPMIGIPTTAGTGSEAQSYALISDAETHAKMACGDARATFRAVLLDPSLTVSQPRAVTAVSGFDALAHAVETAVTTRRNSLSETFSREAWRLLEGNYERVLVRPEDLEARGAMQLGAYFAGVAIENSMLGAAHACANPLTARYGTEHGAALAALLPSVVRWNRRAAGVLYDELLSFGNSRRSKDDGESLAGRLEELREAGELDGCLSSLGVVRDDLHALAEDAAGQWTGRFNPRDFDAGGALEVYECAY